MTYLLTAILIIAVSMVVVAKFMMWLVEKMTAITITQRFQDAEYILTYHEPPQNWHVFQSSFVRFMQGATVGNFVARLRHALALDGGEMNRQEQLLARLDDLIDFFDTCPFFQDEGSREILLDQLWDERDQWAQQSIRESE